MGKVFTRVASIRRLSSVAVFSLLLTGVGVSAAHAVATTPATVVAATAPVSTARTVTRISGPDRYATAIAISQESFPTHASTVFIATGTNYPDALSAAPAAVAQKAPLLLTTPDALLDSVRSELMRLAPSTIVIVGGTASISAGVQDSLGALAPTVTRISGADRYATSKSIATYAFGAGGAQTAYVATGANFPDALSAGSAAGSHGAPVVLVNGAAAAVGQPTLSLISGLGVGTVKIAGGEASVSAGVQQSLNQQTSTARLSGTDRFATSVALNQDAYTSSSTAYLANGYNFPDALAGAVLAGTTDAPLFTIPSTCVPQSVLDEFDRLGVTTVVLLGGTASLNSSVADLVSCSPQVTAAPAASAPTVTPTVLASTAMPVGNLPGWTQTGAQDFSTPAALGTVGTVYGADMRGYSGLPDTSGHGTYTPDSVLSVSNGMLDYYLHTEGGVPRVATAIPFGYAGQTYGRYSIRFRSDSIPGYKIAFLLWPSSDNWNEGEIDWPEGSLNGKMSPASAIKGSLDSQWNMSFDAVSPRSWSPTDSSAWHVATTEWTPGMVKWFWDGVLVGQTSNAAGVPTTNFRWTLQAETELGSALPPVESAGHLQVDWAVQYAYTPAG
jgi:putative cell wall-binding protein